VLVVVVLEEVVIDVDVWPSSLLLGLEVKPKGQPLLSEETREEGVVPSGGVEDEEVSRAEGGGVDEEGDE
jgi:hypothetical protein